MSEDVVQRVIAILDEVPDLSSQLEILSQVKFNLTRTPLTADDIEKKNYTYVSAFMNDGRFEKFLVPTRVKSEALVLARQYADRQGWNSGTTFTVYVGNYIKEAHKLFAEGKFL